MWKYYRFLRRFRLFNNKLRTSQSTTLGNIKNKITHNQYVEDMKELLDAMEKKRYNTKLIGFLFFGGLSLMFFDKILGWFSVQTTEITSRSLKDPIFRKETVEFCEAIVEDLVKSPKIQASITDLLGLAVKNLANEEYIQNELALMFKRIFMSKLILDTGSEYTCLVVEDLLKNEQFYNMITEHLFNQVQTLSNDPETQKQVSILLKHSLKKMFWS